MGKEIRERKAIGMKKLTDIFNIIFLLHLECYQDAIDQPYSKTEYKNKNCSLA